MHHCYWDSDCFLGWLQAEADKEARCKAVLQEARAGTVTIITSALTIAEVLALKGRPKIQTENRLLVEKFFKNEFIVVRSVTRRISETARELVWDYGIMPKDAIHVATAIDAKIEIFHTFDQGLLKKTGLVGEPKIILERPSVIQSRLPLPMFDDEV